MGANLNTFFSGVTGPGHPDTVFVELCGCVYPAYRNQPTRQVQATERRTRGGNQAYSPVSTPNFDKTLLLPQELRKQYQVITDLRTDIRSLQGDNLKLYEKVRYMQSYQSEASSSAVRGTLDPLPSNSNGRTDDINKYRTRYEEAMNPFEVFRGRVRTPPCLHEGDRTSGSHTGIRRKQQGRTQA